MKKTKTQKGITLIALIITIVVLMILAVVTINSIRDGGIITHAQNAANKYTAASEEELVKLAYTEYKLAKMSGQEAAALEIEGATVTENGNAGWSVAFDKTGNTYNMFEDGSVGVPEYDWEIKDADSQITATFYKTNEMLDEITLYYGGDTIVFPAGNAYKLVIEGTGDMGSIVTFDEDHNAPTNAYAWQTQAMDFINGNGNQYIMPYVTDVTIGDGITTIGEGAFMYFASLRNIKISNTVTTIDGFAFLACESLTNVTLPSSINTIDSIAFYPVLDLDNDSNTEAKDYNIYIERTDPEGFNVTKFSTNPIVMPAFLMPKGTIYVKNEAMAAALEGTIVSNYVTIKIK